MNVTENCRPAHKAHLARLINILFAIVWARSDPRRHPDVRPQRCEGGRGDVSRGQADPSGTAEMTTNACASGPSSVTVTSIRASWPAGLIALHRSTSPP